MAEFVITGFADEIDDDLKVQMDVLEKLGIYHIEMRGVNGKRLVQYSLDEVMNIRKELDKRGFRISAIGSPIGKTRIVDDFTSELQLFKHSVEIAKILDTKYIRIFSFFIPEGEKAETYKDEVIRRFNEFAKVLKGTGIIMLHENDIGTYGDIPERCMDLFKSVNSNQLKGIIDIGNFVKCGVENVLEAYKQLQEDIVYVHIKDAIPSEEHFLPIGHGMGMAKEVFSALYMEHHNYYLSIEPHLKYLPVSGPEQFKIAAEALKKLLYEVTGKQY